MKYTVEMSQNQNVVQLSLRVLDLLSETCFLWLLCIRRMWKGMLTSHLPQLHNLRKTHFLQGLFPQNKDQFKATECFSINIRETDINLPIFNDYSSKCIQNV